MWGRGPGRAARQSRSRIHDVAHYHWSNTLSPVNVVRFRFLRYLYPRWYTYGVSGSRDSSASPPVYLGTFRNFRPILESWVINYGRRLTTTRSRFWR
jgi:hypothetical protein